MDKEFRYVCVQPDDTYYTWQVHLWLESLKNRNESDKAIVLIFIPKYRDQNPKWQQIIDLYPEAEFHFYKDDNDAVTSLLPVYIPVLRPYTLWRHWKTHPELKDYAIFYCDSDVLFTEQFDVQQFIDDDVCYLSDTLSYINADYFDSKVRDVLPDKLEEYKTRNVLAELGEQIGITREEAVSKNADSGGAQYLLKDVDADFWYKVMGDCIIIRSYLQKINREFFESENRGFQSWCADMWAVLWNLWVNKKEVRVIKEMGFSWAPDPVEKLKTHPIYHNAGIVGPEMDGYKCFYKGKYHTGVDPTKDPHLDDVLNDEKSKPRCTWFYANELKKLANKYNLNY
jgi:hypothetical protein